MAEPTGLEPATSDVTGRRSNQLNYDSAKNYFQSSISDLRSSIKSAIRNPKSEIICWWARRDSNPQPLPCKGSRLPLTYVPFSKIIRNYFVTTKCDRKERIDGCQARLASRRIEYRLQSGFALTNNKCPTEVGTLYTVRRE